MAFIKWNRKVSHPSFLKIWSNGKFIVRDGVIDIELKCPIENSKELSYCKKLMVMCFDIGNTNIFAGVLNSQNELRGSFRLPTENLNDSSSFAGYLELFLKNNSLRKMDIQQVGICSVVPNLTKSLIAVCGKTFGFPPFVLTADTAPFLKIHPEMALNLGADMIATAVACFYLFKSNCIIVDLGTATTVSAIDIKGTFLGAIIIPGIKTSLDSLTEKAAQIPPIPLEKPNQLLSSSTVVSCQAGAYYGHLGAIKEVAERFRRECFPEQPVSVVGTGGLANLYMHENVFDIIDSDLILKGVSIAIRQAEGLVGN